MIPEKIDKSKITLVSALDVDQNLLNEYYKILYPNRINSLPFIWKWIYRTDFSDKKSPIVMLYSGRVIAHEGMIPIHVKVNGKLFTASWLVDLAVLPEFRKQGLSSILEKKALEFSDLTLGLRSNNEALGLHKKLGFQQCTESFLHTFLLIPFNHPYFVEKLPKILRKVLNTLFNPFIWLHYSVFSSALRNEDLNLITNDSLDKLENLFNIPEIQERYRNIVLPLRDRNFIRWRIIESPDRNKYRLISNHKISAIIKLDRNTIDILWISDVLEFKVIRNMIAGIALWGMKNGFTYLRLYTSIRESSQFLKRSLFSHVKQSLYVYYTDDKELAAELDYSKWNWQLIDSDFEHFSGN